MSLSKDQTRAKICSVEGCDRRSRARGLCNAHYERARLASSPRTQEVKRVYRSRNIERAKRQQKARRLLNIERFRARDREWRLSNSEKLAAQARRWKALNSQRNKDNLRAWRAANRHRIREYMKSWRAANKERIAQSLKDSRQEDPGKVNSYNRTRRAKQNLAEGSFTHEDWNSLLARSSCCYWCRQKWTGKRRPTLDHIIPLSKGGAHTIENAVCACKNCNSRKKDLLINPINGQGILV